MSSPLPEDFEGARTLVEAAADVRALHGRVVFARVMTADGTTIAEAQGRVRTGTSGTPPERFTLSFGGHPPEIQRAEYLAGQHLPVAKVVLSLSTSGFRAAQLQTLDGTDYFTLMVETNEFRLAITDP